MCTCVRSKRVNENIGDEFLIGQVVCNALLKKGEAKLITVLTTKQLVTVFTRLNSVFTKLITVLTELTIVLTKLITVLTEFITVLTTKSLARFVFFSSFSANKLTY